MATLTVCFLTKLDAVQFEDIGFKAGWNNSSISVPNSSFDYGIRNTLSFGGTVSVRFNERIGLQVEFLSVTNGYDNTSISHRLEYLQMPILAKFVIKKGEKITWEALIGPAFSKKTDQGFIDKSFTSANEYGIFFSEYDKAIVGGIDLGFPFSIGQIVVSPRYYWGLTEHADFGVKNRAFSLLVGYAVSSFQ